VQRMVQESGGAAAKGIQQSEEGLDEQQAERIEDWIRDLCNGKEASRDGLEVNHP
jgi:hypothetical protein